MVAANSNATLSLTLGWFFPHRDHYNYNHKTEANFVPYENQYAKIYPQGSEQAAWGDIPVVDGARSQALSAVVQDITVLHKPFMQSSLPLYLQDLLVNSLSHTRDVMWWQNCPACHVSSDPRVNGTAGKGFWRQFEAYDCPDLDSIHNDGERHIPYIMFFPDGTRSKLAAWAGNQQANGMLAEQILNTHPDTPQGRVMSDSTSMFILYVLELLLWEGDTNTALLYYPTVKRAAEWQIQASKTFEVPLSLETTYDILQFPKYQLSTYSTIFPPCCF
eukprot:TRINITY_DN2439_c0_g1_i1.p1 TRINITY_DN2439_c0_g1~~TRINITY_DN2439_c0_g1_i1.p1  ORF type:complete len:275 (-),score=19.66 TRINITY_DN2439_c0_g1_i1:58-882(-)